MDTNTYIKILTDTLIKKNEILDELIIINIRQETMLSSLDINIESLDGIIDKKQELITQLNQLDDGFEIVYGRIQEEIKHQAFIYREEIVIMQGLIKEIIEKSTTLQAKEKTIKSKIEYFLTRQKQEIKNYKVSSQTVSNYYKNMMNEYHGESYFLDKKK